MYGFVSSLVSYLHLVFGGFILCWKRLIVMSCGLWTEDQLKEYRILTRAALADADGDGKTSASEAVASITARSHGLYWLFVPGFSIFLKMCAYMGEAPLRLEAFEALRSSHLCAAIARPRGSTLVAAP